MAHSKLRDILFAHGVYIYLILGETELCNFRSDLFLRSFSIHKICTRELMGLQILVFEFRIKLPHISSCFLAMYLEWVPP